LSDTTMLKNGRPLEPPRESRMTTMIYPSGGAANPKGPPTEFFQRRDTRHGHPASDTLKSPRL
jgi:hypothetical protein